MWDRVGTPDPYSCTTFLLEWLKCPLFYPMDQVPAATLVVATKDNPGKTITCLKAWLIQMTLARLIFKNVTVFKGS
jgi:hypothetical protein